MVLLATNEPREVELAVGYGRCEFQASTRRHLRLQLAGVPAALELARGQAVLEVQPRLAGGWPPDRAPAVWVRTWSSSELTLTWNGAPQQLAAPSVVLRDGVPLDPPVADAFPEPPDRAGDSAALQELAAALPDLSKLAELHRTDLAAILARQSLAQMGQFGPLVAALDESDNDWEWADNLALLRLAAAHSPASANAVHFELSQQLHPELGAIVFRQLAGYAGEQFPAVAPRLIDLLEHPRLAVRVAAFDTLRRITHTTQLYRPQAPTAEQAARIRSWRRLLAVPW